MGCLFCNNLEKKYKPNPGNNFICSRCVQLFLGADQKELKRAYDKAIDKGYQGKYIGALKHKTRAVRLSIIDK